MGGSLVRFRLRLLIAALFCILWQGAQGQQHLLDRKVSITINQKDIATALKRLGKVANCSFSYINSVVPADKPVKATTYQNTSLREILSNILSDAGTFEFLEDGRVIHIKPYVPPASINGEIIDEQGQIIEGVSLRLEETNTGATSDRQGRFHLQPIRPGNYTVVVSSVGYQIQKKIVRVNAGQSLRLDLQLEVDHKLLDQVNVLGKTETQQLKESGFAVNAVDLKPFANSTADLNQVLSRTTGVKIRETGGLGSDYQFYINGLTGNHIRFFLDGIPLENLGNNFRLNNIPVNFAKRLEVYKGVVPIELGSDALGGAVNIVTDQSIHHFVDASYSYGSFNTHRASLNTRLVDPKSGVIASFNGFYNYSDNNYWMRNNPEYNVILEITEDGRYVEKDRIRRFYDRYQSGMGNAEIGVSNKKWADLATIGVNYSNNNRQLQTGSTINAVNGGLYTTDRNIMPTLRYRKENFLLSGLNTSLNAAFGFNKFWVRDTAQYEYDWSGKWIQPLGVHDQQAMEYTGTAAEIKSNWTYALDKHHSFSLNYTFDRNTRGNFNHLLAADNNENLVPPKATAKHIAGLAYQGNYLDDRLTASLLLKYYGQQVTKEQLKLLRQDEKEGAIYETIIDGRQTKNKGYWSYGANARFILIKDLGIKASYEKGYRLPVLDELYGDGKFVKGDQDLRPESSNNYNFGAYYTYPFGKHRLAFEGNLFFRNAHDFIYNQVTGPRYTAFKNAGRVQVKGYDAEVNYDYGNLLYLSVNVSYQRPIDNNKYINDAEEGQESITYKATIPNMPWLYGNAEFGLGKDDLLGKDTRIQFTWYSQYTHWFYLSWSTLGAKDTKNIIPTQFVHNASVTYSWQKGKYNVTVESHNLTDALAYDNFRLQKPGRSFQVKLRYFFM